MIGPLEIVILLVILLIVFGGYKKLPSLGRSAGKGARVGSEKAKELAGTVSKKAEAFDPASVGKAAGENLRGARDVRDSFKDLGNSSPTSSGDTKPKTGTVKDSDTSK
jgi:TatA/E family protein of Tat protein translocase